MNPQRLEPVLLLDVMGTLVYDPFYVEVPEFLGLSFKELMAAKHPTAWCRFESGEIDEQRMLAEFFLDGRRVRAGLRECMAANYRWLPGMRELVERLAVSGYAMHAHSNYPDWYRSIELAIGLSRHVPWTFVSCNTGLRKPDPEAYLGAAKKLGVRTEACLFVDDREENCAAARGIGMRSIRFRDAVQLETDLRAEGLEF